MNKVERTSYDLKRHKDLTGEKPRINIVCWTEGETVCLHGSDYTLIDVPLLS